MKSYLLKVLLLLMLPLSGFSQCYNLFLGTYLSSENCSSHFGPEYYTITVSLLTSTQIGIWGLWAQGTTVSADLVCNSDSFTIPYQVVGNAFFEGGGRLIGNNVQISYRSNYVGIVADTCIRYYHPGVAIDRSTTQTARVYPNPFVNELRIDADKFVNGPIQLQLFDLQGKKLKSIAIEGPDQSLNTSDLSPGVYLFDLQQAGTMIERSLLFKK